MESENRLEVFVIAEGEKIKQRERQGNRKRGRERNRVKELTGLAEIVYF